MKCDLTRNTVNTATIFDSYKSTKKKPTVYGKKYMYGK